MKHSKYGSSVQGLPFLEEHLKRKCSSCDILGLNIVKPSINQYLAQILEHEVSWGGWLIRALLWFLLELSEADERTVEYKRWVCCGLLLIKCLVHSERGDNRAGFCCPSQFAGFVSPGWHMPQYNFQMAFEVGCNKVFAKWLSEESPNCVPLSEAVKSSSL